jgi:hypothetical protein
MSGIPVVNYARMERLKLPEGGKLPLNLNTFCIAFIILVVLWMYKRSVTISQRRGQSYI